MTKVRDDVIVIGGGLVGLNTAYQLHQAGYGVRLIERRESVALETSFANAGMATPSMSEPWNKPGVHWDLLRYLGRTDAPMLLRADAVWQYIGWGIRFLRFSTPARFEAAMRANFQLSSYSLKQLRSLRESLGLVYELRSKGTLKVFRGCQSFDAAAADSEKLKQFGLRYKVLDQAEALAVEPVLEGNADSIVGALHNLDDETGDAHRFCQELQLVLAERGVRFDFNTEVTSLRIESGEITGVITSNGVLGAKCVVVAGGSWSPRLLRGTGISVSIKPVKGYSITAPLRDLKLLPSMAIIDNDLHAAVTPFDTRIRMAGTAEFAGWNARLDPARLGNLWTLAETVNPAMAAAADREKAINWCGFRPMAADGNPYIGATRVPGLYLNAGHGYLGWTQAAGSGRLLAQIIAGKQPDIDISPYRVDRP
jgi:D-amino-acid dehydrogenase